MANDLFQVLVESADAACNAAVSAIQGAVGFAVSQAPGVVAGVGGAVAYGVSQVNEAARDMGAEVANAVTPSTNPFAGLLAGVDLGWNQQPQTMAAEASLADLGDLGAQLGNYAQQRQTGAVMAI